MADLSDMLWKAAGKLRGTLDAGQYKDLVLGLVFLRYTPGWDALAAGLGHDGLAGRLDGALAAALEQAVPPAFAGVDQQRLAELVDLIGTAPRAGSGRDVLGEVYEYFLDRFARAEGRRGGEFYTPACVVRLLVEMLEPFSGRVYDPCCGSGGMFVQAEKFVAAHRRDTGALALFGQESNARTWRLAAMNLAIHGLAADLGARCADTFREDLHPGLRADYVLANPPFNLADWSRQSGDPRWRLGLPPAGNANFAWLQHIASKLSVRGSAGVVLANGSMSARAGGEGEIRSAMLDDDLVACMVALPGQLFRTTQIPACLWLLAADKSGTAPDGTGPDGTGPDDAGGTDRRGQVLFIDARALGTLVSRTERVFSPAEIGKVAGAYRAWRGAPSARAAGLAYADEPGFCSSAGRAELRAQDDVLSPGRYVAPAVATDPAGPPAAQLERLARELFAHFDKAARLDGEVRAQLARLRPGTLAQSHATGQDE
jgi:type I restriction enzyme M protein